MHLLALLLLAAPAAPAAATADALPTTRGTMGVSFSLPGDPTIGATFFLANDLALRIDGMLNAKLKPGGAGRDIQFSLALGLRSYQLKHERVALFLQPVVAFGREPSPSVTTSESAEFITFGAGAGVEYFFTSHFSAGAILGIALKFSNLAGPANNPVYIDATTATSALQANYYF